MTPLCTGRGHSEGRAVGVLAGQGGRGSDSSQMLVLRGRRPRLRARPSAWGQLVQRTAEQGDASPLHAGAASARVGPGDGELRGVSSTQ